MRERFDFRMDEVKAKQFLPSNVGVKLDELTRKVELAADDPLFERIRQIDHDLRNQGLGRLFGGWTIIRKYSSKELDSAEILSCQRPKAEP